LCLRHRNGYGSLRAKARALNDFPQAYSSTDGALAPPQIGIGKPVAKLLG